MAQRIRRTCKSCGKPISLLTQAPGEREFCGKCAKLGRSDVVRVKELSKEDIYKILIQPDIRIFHRMVAFIGFLVFLGGLVHLGISLLGCFIGLVAAPALFFARGSLIRGIRWRFYWKKFLLSYWILYIILFIGIQGFTAQRLLQWAVDTGKESLFIKNERGVFQFFELRFGPRVVLFLLAFGLSLLLATMITDRWVRSSDHKLKGKVVDQLNQTKLGRENSGYTEK